MGFFSKLSGTKGAVVFTDKETFSVPFLCHFSKKQIEMIREMSLVDERSKGSVVRKAITTLYDQYKSDIK